MTADYSEFLQQKIKLDSRMGFAVEAAAVNPLLFDHQRDIVRWAVRGGRRAIFAAFGLGKTLVCGVITVGRPVARHYDDGWTLEVTRCCTNGKKNACSMLYGAARRAAWALGYKRLITYILSSENGSSLKAAGYRLIGMAGGGSWNTPSRPRVQTAPKDQKLLFEAT